VARHSGSEFLFVLTFSVYIELCHHLPHLQQKLVITDVIAAANSSLLYINYIVITEATRERGHMNVRVVGSSSRRLGTSIFIAGNMKKRMLHWVVFKLQHTLTVLVPQKISFLK
jgi:hypothetical protein